MQSIQFITWNRLLQLCFVRWLPDLFLNNEPSIISLNKELWNSIFKCYSLPDYDFRDEFLVLFKTCCAPLAALAVARAHRVRVLLIRIHKLRHDACWAHVILYTLLSTSNLLLCQPRWHQISHHGSCHGRTWQLSWLVVRGMRTSSNVSTSRVVHNNIPANNSSLCICENIILEQNPYSIHDLLQQRQIMIVCWFSSG